MTHDPGPLPGPADGSAGRASSRARHRLGALALVGLTALGLVGLGAARTIDARPHAGAARATEVARRAPVATHALATRTSVTDVVGHLPPAVRDQVAAKVTESVDHWIDGAYLGSYPRTDFSSAWSTFTPGAARMAAADASLTSNRTIGGSLSAVRATGRRLELQVLAVRGAPVGVTARLRLGLDVVDDAAHHRHEVVSGSLYLGYDKAGDAGATAPGWHVFGYDIARGEA